MMSATNKYTIQERHFRNDMYNALTPVFSMLSGGGESGAYTYGELCEAIISMLQSELERVRKMDAERHEPIGNS